MYIEDGIVDDIEARGEARWLCSDVEPSSPSKVWKSIRVWTSQASGTGRLWKERSYDGALPGASDRGLRA